MRAPNWIRIGKPRREGNEVVYPLSIDEEEAIREGQRRLREAGWIMEEAAAGFAEGMRRIAEAAGQVGVSDDPSLGPDAARWTPEDDGKDAANGTP